MLTEMAHDICLTPRKCCLILQKHHRCHVYSETSLISQYTIPTPALPLPPCIPHTRPGFQDILLQVAAQEAMVAGQSGVAKEALQQLHGLLVKAPAADSFKPGDEAVILTNLIRLVQETAPEAAQGMQSCIVNLFKLDICLGSKTPTGNGRAVSYTLQALRACISLVPAHSHVIHVIHSKCSTNIYLCPEQHISGTPPHFCVVPCTTCIKHDIYVLAEVDPDPVDKLLCCKLVQLFGC